MCVCVCVYVLCVRMCLYVCARVYQSVCMSNISAHSFSSTVAMGTNDDQLKLANVHHNMTPLVASRWYNLGLELGVEPYVLEIIEGGRMKPE